MTNYNNKRPCISCDSSDALHVYEKGDGYCFSCNTYFHKDQIDAESTNTSNRVHSAPSSAGINLKAGKALDVPQRGLTSEALAYYGVTAQVSETNGEVVSLTFPVYRKGERTGNKTKILETKQIFTDGSAKDPDFFGANKAGSGGRLLIITEGEEDCMAAHMLLRQQGKEYNVVSLPNGANSRAVKSNLEWLETFESIVLNFDNDAVGKEAAREVASILSPGKVKIMQLPTKDANEFLLKKYKSKDYLKAVWNARAWRPDGIVNLADAWDTMWEDENMKSIPYPWVGMNKKLYGMREREIVTVCAGTGVGKSALIRELEHYLLNSVDDNIGILALEESVGRTSWGIVSVEANLPLSIREERPAHSKEDIKKCWDRTLGTGRVFTLDHFGSTSEGELLQKVRYLIKGMGCKWIILDHISIVVSAMDEKGDERRTIDAIMTKLRQITEETGVGMFVVSHLRRTGSDRGHEEGLEVSLSHLRGSQSISQLSDAVVALERNQQAENDLQSNLTTVRVLKNRYAGLTGIATHLAYSRDTGRLTEILDVGKYLIPETDRGM